MPHPMATARDYFDELVEGYSDEGGPKLGAYVRVMGVYAAGAGARPGSLP